MQRVNVLEAAQAANFRKYITNKLGSLDDWTVLFSNVLLATYILPEKTIGGIIRPQSNISQDVWQGKVGLILKLGETAFKYDGPYEYVGRKPKVGEYVMCHSSDPREVGINGQSCKIVDSSLCRMIVPDPDALY